MQWVLLGLLICSLCLNAWLLSANYIRTHAQKPVQVNSLTGMRDRPLVFRKEGMWSPQYDPALANHTELDALWHKAVSGFGVVALDKQWALDQGLKPTRAWPLDRSKAVYVFSAYHAVHCVRSLRIIYQDLLAGKPIQDHWRGHGLHCFEIIREEIMCRADDTLYASPLDRTHRKSLRIGVEETRQCTDWEYLRDWSGKHTAGYMTEEGDDFDKSYIENPPLTDGWELPPRSDI